MRDLSPAKISDKIYAFSKLARVDVPLSGHVGMVVTDTGLVTDAKASSTPPPAWSSFRITSPAGSMSTRATCTPNIDPDDGSVEITQAQLLMGSSQARMKGRLSPLRSADGHLTAIDI